VLDRVQGFREAIGKFPGITVVADVNGQAVRDKSLEVTADVLQANPRLDGIFGINDASALGALDAVEQFKRTNIIIVGYDATPPAADAITRGTFLKADVIQYPKKIGTITIEMIRDFFAGKQVPPVVPVEVGIADAEYFLKNPQK
jgi:ribose transport system substrate-binding protein